MANLLIRNARPMAGETADILIADGRIAKIGTVSAVEAGDTAVEEARGAIAIPGLVDSHTHLDKTLWGMAWYPGRTGAGLQGLIDNERNSRIPLGLDVHRQSMRHAALLVGNGTTHVRSHVDVDTDHKLTLLHGLLRTREALREIIDMQIVAFPQSGLMVRPGTYELLDAALQDGADIVGGLDPAVIDRDPKGSLDAVFGLAEKHGKPIDIHLHEPGELGAFSLELIMERTKAHGFQGRVGVSHAFCLGMADQIRAGALMDGMAELDIRIFTNGNPSQTIPSFRALRAAGIKVGIGCDGIRDTWSPWGRPDLLHRIQIVAMKNGMRRDDDLKMLLEGASSAGAEAMGIAGHRLEVGAAADLTLLEGESLPHAIVEALPRPLVVKSGRVVGRSGNLSAAGIDIP